MKPVRLSKHAQDYTTSRGFTAAEVEEAIRTSPWEEAEVTKQIKGTSEYLGFQTESLRNTFVFNDATFMRTGFQRCP